jgi:hypothetical protein
MYWPPLSACLRVAQTVGGGARARRASVFVVRFLHVFSRCRPTIFSASRFFRAARCSHHLEVCTGRIWVRVCVWRGQLLLVPGLGARSISAESAAKFDAFCLSSLCFSEKYSKLQVIVFFFSYLPDTVSRIQKSSLCQQNKGHISVEIDSFRAQNQLAVGFFSSYRARIDAGIRALSARDSSALGKRCGLAWCARETEETSIALGLGSQNRLFLTSRSPLAPGIELESVQEHACRTRPTRAHLANIAVVRGAVVGRWKCRLRLVF